MEIHFEMDLEAKGIEVQYINNLDSFLKERTGFLKKNESVLTL